MGWDYWKLVTQIAFGMALGGIASRVVAIFIH